MSLTTASDNEDMPLAVKKIAADTRFFLGNTERFVRVSGIDVVSDKAPLTEIVRRNASKYPASSGCDVEPEFGGPELVPEVADIMLRRGYTEMQVRGVLGENWLRVARQVWK